METKEQPELISLPLSDIIWNILGDDANGLMCAKITRLTADILSEKLKDNLRWIVEYHDKDGNELPIPILWRYSEWKSSSDTYERQKKYAHNRRVEGWIVEKNIMNLAKAIMKETRMSVEQAKPIAAMLIHKCGSERMEVLKALGLNKLVTQESEL